MMIRRVPSVFFAPNFAPDLNRLLNSFIESTSHQTSGCQAAAFPQVNVYEDDNGLLVEAELPGLKMEDLDLTVLGDTLTIAGGRESTAPEGAAMHRRERRGGRFSRTLKFRTPIEGSHVVATLDSGMLRITLPKAQSARPRKVTINAN